jgi:hypothetical protein
MIAERELRVERPIEARLHEGVRPAVGKNPQGTAPPRVSFLWRVLMVVVGSTIAVLGWALIMSVFLIFIGLPLFIFGLALMQAAQEP